MPPFLPSGKPLPALLAATHLSVITELLGRNGADALLRSAHLESWISEPPRADSGPIDFTEFSALQHALVDTLGWRGARGLSLRMGARDFEVWLRPVGAIAAMEDPAFQAFPLDRRQRAGLHGVARTMNQLASLEADATEAAELEFSLAACPECWGRSAAAPVCATMAGLVAAALRWIAPEVPCRTEELACRAAGDPACRFSVLPEAA